MTNKIELKDMKFYAYHGVSPQENQVGNTFVVNLILSAPLQEAMKSDCLAQTINYAEIFEIVKNQMAIPSRLLEHLAGRIVSALKQHFPQIRALYLKVSKLNPPFGGEVHSASVIVEENWP